MVFDKKAAEEEIDEIKDFYEDYTKVVIDIKRWTLAIEERH
ncbi:MAG TPA: hypothetical protein PKH50_00175 [bacterium]|jgi:hypothetical protein|nr:hypothetical protein [bacterium]